MPQPFKATASILLEVSSRGMGAVTCADGIRPREGVKASGQVVELMRVYHAVILWRGGVVQGLSCMLHQSKLSPHFYWVCFSHWESHTFN